MLHKLTSAELALVLRDHCPIAYGTLGALEGCASVSEEQIEAALDEAEAAGGEELGRFVAAEARRLEERNEQMSQAQRAQSFRAFRGQAFRVLALNPNQRRYEPRRTRRSRVLGRAPRGRRTVRRVAASRDGPARSTDDDPHERVAHGGRR